MPRKWIAVALPALLLTAGAAIAQDAPPPGGKETSISFINHGGINNYVPDSKSEGIYIQDNHRKWYYARFFTRCLDLPYGIQIGIKTFGGSDTLDRGSTILVGRERCQIQSLVESGPPPRKVKKPKQD
jgi:hypothetical protein